MQQRLVNRKVFCGRFAPVTLFRDKGSCIIAKLLVGPGQVQRVANVCRKLVLIVDVEQGDLILKADRLVVYYRDPEAAEENAIYKIEVEDFPAFILVDDKGNDFFQQLPCSV